MSFKSKLLITSVFAVALAAVGFSGTAEYRGSSSTQVWNVVKNAGPYNNEGTLPVFQAGLTDLLSWTTQNIRQAAQRTVSDRSDVLPNFQKLVHANGICFAGSWNITQDSPYTGYFATGSRGKIITRLSEASGNPAVGPYRSFGFAGKIYPEADASGLAKTANFQTIDDLGGTLAKHFTDVALTNKPAVSKTSQLGKTLDIALTVAAGFRLADSHIGERQLYEISELGLADPAEAHTPNWMMIRPSVNTAKVDRADFRDELRLENYEGHKLNFDIFVASAGEKTWTYLGFIELNDYTLSVGCDHNLHFHHPKWRNDLN